MNNFVLVFIVCVCSHPLFSVVDALFFANIHLSFFIYIFIFINNRFNHCSEFTDH